jgi:hypothetical protein
MPSAGLLRQDAAIARAIAADRHRAVTGCARENGASQPFAGAGLEPVTPSLSIASWDSPPIVTNRRSALIGKFARSGQASCGRLRHVFFP